MRLGYFSNILILLTVIVLIGCRHNSKKGFEEVSELPIKPNILFIYLDDMGYGDPQCFNSESLIPTPNMITNKATYKIKLFKDFGAKNSISSNSPSLDS